MSEKQIIKPVAVAVSTALAGTFAIAATADADTGVSPFAMTTLASGYLLGAQEGSCGEGKCGGDKGDEEGGDMDLGDEDDNEKPKMQTSSFDLLRKLNDEVLLSEALKKLNY